MIEKVWIVLHVPSDDPICRVFDNQLEAEDFSAQCEARNHFGVGEYITQCWDVA